MRILEEEAFEERILWEKMLNWMKQEDTSLYMFVPPIVLKIIVMESEPRPIDEEFDKV